MFVACCRFFCGRVFVFSIVEQRAKSTLRGLLVGLVRSFRSRAGVDLLGRTGAVQDFNFFRRSLAFL